MRRRPASLSARERVRLTLRGQFADRVPFTVYWLMLPRGEAAGLARAVGESKLDVIEAFTLRLPAT